MGPLHATRATLTQSTMSNTLEQLKKFTTVVSDSGDFESIAVYKPQDATTNPSLILAAVKKPEYARLIDVAVEYAKKKGGDVDTEGTKSKAKHLIELYKEVGIPKERILIKIASTWEGIQAARALEQEGIHCNLTLLFGFQQAVACAEAQVTLISPFVGRILDWYKKNKPDGDYAGAKDPGVQSVTKIYQYYKTHGYKTIVMGASFRSVSEVEELAGCDFLTISPALLKELQGKNDELKQRLSVDNLGPAQEKVTFVDNEPAFRWSLLQDQMAFDKLHEGIKKFAEDAEELKSLLKAKLQ